MKEDLKNKIQSLIANSSIEVTPKGAEKIETFEEALPHNHRVFITFLPGSNIQDTIDTAIRLKKEHMEPIPHIAARSIPNVEFLEDALRKLTKEANVRKLLLIGGGVENPVGDFEDTVQLLHTGLLEKYRIEHIAIAGHPEGTPDFSDAAHWDALQKKQEFSDHTGISMQITTQFCFEIAPFISYCERLKDASIKIDLVAGIPGLATIKTLLMHAKHCGIGPSMRVITRQAANITKLMTVREPNKLMFDMAQYCLENPDSHLKACHLYPLGGYAKTSLWAKIFEKDVSP